MDTTTQILLKSTESQPVVHPIEGAAEPTVADPPVPEILTRWVVDQSGRSLREHSEEGPVLVVFLRHLGCPFCREALADLAAQRKRIESHGIRLALVFMSEEEKAAAFFERYRLGDVPRFADPARRLYRSFGLRRGTFRQLFGWKAWWRGFVVGILRRRGIGRLRGDALQMPGTFLVERGSIVSAFRHRSAADRPDYESIASCPAPDARGRR